MRTLRQKVTNSYLSFHSTSKILCICYGTPQNCVHGVSFSTKLVKFNQFCTFKDMSVESKGLHPQICVYRNLACQCTVMTVRSRIVIG